MQARVIEPDSQGGLDHYSTMEVKNSMFGIQIPSGVSL